MTSGALEQVLYDLGNSGRSRKAYLEDEEAFLSRYRLESDEIGLVRALDVSEMMRRGLSPMLLMGFYMGLRGPQSMREFVSKMPTLAAYLDERTSNGSA